MNRGQIKRLRKEIDHLRNGGKEWEALRMIDREDAIDGFRSEWDDLWRSQARHALRTAPLMELFLSSLNGFSTVPDSPDIRFMKIIGDYLDGADVTTAISKMSGLSPPAETLRRELLRRQNETLPDDAKLRKLLKAFATAPDAVLQKDYRQLRTLLAPYPAIFQDVSGTVEELLVRSRKLNSASSVKKKLHGFAESELHSIDLALRSLLSSLPEHFFSVVTAPVLAQVSIAVLRIAENSPDQGARMALAAPFCMERLAGSDWPAMQNKFQLEVAKRPTTADRASLRKTANTATFEECFTLVRKITSLMISQDLQDQDIQLTLVILYKRIFRELTVRRATLPEREKRRLTDLLGPIFSKDIHLLFSCTDELPLLLDSAAAAGCLDPVSALLHTYFAVLLRDRVMIANARAMLKILPQIKESDVQSFFNEHQFLLTEGTRALKGALDVCRESGHELDSHFATGLSVLLLTNLVMNTLVGGEQNSFMAMLLDPMSDESARMCKKLVKGMDCFAGNSFFSIPVELAKGFSSGIISGKDMGKLIEKLLNSGQATEQTIELFVVTLEMVKATSKTQQMDMPFRIAASGGDSLLKELLFSGLDALCGKKDLAARHTTDNLTTLVDVMRIYSDGRGMERYMMLIGNAAAERMLEGDEAASALHKNTMEYISKNAKPEKKRGRQR